MVSAKQILAVQKATGPAKQTLLATFIRENEALVDYVVLKFAAQWKLEHQLDDLKQQARLAMVKAVGSFKIKKNGINKTTGKRFSAKTWNCAMYFSNWYWLISRDELQKAAKALGERDHRAKGARPIMVPLQDTYSSSATMATPFMADGSAVLGQCDNQELVTAINELPVLEREVILALADGDSVATIGKRYGLSDPAEFVESIRRKLV